MTCVEFKKGNAHKESRSAILNSFGYLLFLKLFQNNIISRTTQLALTPSLVLAIFSIPFFGNIGFIYCFQSSKFDYFMVIEARNHRTHSGSILLLTKQMVNDCALVSAYDG